MPSEAVTVSYYRILPENGNLNSCKFIPEATPLAAVGSLVEVRVKGRSAVVFGAAGLPGAVDCYQVSFRVPAGIVKGSAAIELSAAGVAGTRVNITVQENDPSNSTQEDLFMLSQHKLIVSLALVLFTASASASPIVYVVTGAQQFGTVDLGTGAFHQIGPDMPEGSDGLVSGPKGSLLTLTFSGNLDSINPATGVTTVIGPTGLGDCTFPPPGSPCGPASASNLVGFGGTLFATDVANRLYTVDPLTGVAKLLGPTGIPPLPFQLLSTNPDGSTNVFDETLFGAGGKLYATFDATTIDFTTSAIKTVIPNALYQIDPKTGHATLVAPTALTLSAAVDVNGTVYAFNAAAAQVVTLDLSNGTTSFVSNYDRALVPIGGAAGIPEPASIALTGIGLAAILVSRRRRYGSKGETL